MKKLFNALLVFALLLSGCSTSDDSKEATSSNSSQEVTENQSGKEDKVEENSKEDKKATIEETVIYDVNGIKVTATKLDNDLIWGTTIKLAIENNTDQNVIISTGTMSINDLMVEPQLWSEVAANKKANDEIIIMSDLKDSNITTIAKIEFTLRILDEKWNDIDEVAITLNTSASDYVQNYDTSGVLVVDQNGLKIYVKKVNTSDSFWGADVYIYIENNSNQTICVQSENVSINGYMVDPVFSCDVNPGKKAYDTITFLESDLEDNGIEDIETLELTFRCFDYTSYSDIFTIGPVSVNFE